MPYNHLSLCSSLLCPLPMFPRIRVFSKEPVLRIRWPKYWSFSFSISPSNEYSGLISFRIDWIDLLAVQGTLKSLLQHHSLKTSILLNSDFFFFFNLILFNFTILYWLYHISKWICHRYTCAPHPEPSSLLPPHTIPLGRPSAPAPSIQYCASNLDWWLVSYIERVSYMFHTCFIYVSHVSLLSIKNEMSYYRK